MRYCKYKGVLFDDEKSLRINGFTHASINSDSTCKIGKAFIINNGPEHGIGNWPSKIIVGKGANLVIGDYSGISSTTLLCSMEITIGRHVNIGGGTMIIDSNHHSTNWHGEDRSLDKKMPVRLLFILVTMCLLELAV